MHNEKFGIRPIVLDDLSFLNEWKNSEEVFKYLGGSYRPVSIDEQRKWMDSLIDSSGNARRFIIFSIDGNVPIGMVGLYNLNHINRNCEIGIYIGNSKYHGMGAASYAVKSLEEYARNYLNIRKIKAYVVSENHHAILFWESQGYEHTGCYRGERFINGRYADVHLYEKYFERATI